MNTGKVILGILAGIATGATLGILFAPDKGTSTRKKIYQKGDDYVEGLEDKFNDIVHGVQHKFDKIRTEADIIVEEARAKADAFTAKMNDNTALKNSKTQS